MQVPPTVVDRTDELITVQKAFSTCNCRKTKVRTHEPLYMYSLQHHLLSHRWGLIKKKW